MTRGIEICDPRIPEILSTYTDRYMAQLGPYVNSVFFVLLLGFAQGKRGCKGYVKTVPVSMNEIAQKSGMSRRKAFDAVKMLKKYWIVVQLRRRGRGNKSRYYFLPVARWLMPEATGL